MPGLGEARKKADSVASSHREARSDEAVLVGWHTEGRVTSPEGIVSSQHADQETNGAGLGSLSPCRPGSCIHPRLRKKPSAEHLRQHGRIKPSTPIPGSVSQMEPRQALLRKNMPRRNELSGLVDRAYVQMNLRRVRHPFARQRGAASAAESAPPAGRRVESSNVTLADLEFTPSHRHEHRNGGTAVPAAALAMTPCHVEWFTGHRKSHRATETPAFNAIAHALIFPNREGKTNIAPPVRPVNLLPSIRGTPLPAAPP
jgi:hypothetical protein